MIDVVVDSFSTHAFLGCSLWIVIRIIIQYFRGTDDWWKVLMARKYGIRIFLAISLAFSSIIAVTVGILNPVMVDVVSTAAQTDLDKKYGSLIMHFIYGVLIAVVMTDHRHIAKVSSAAWNYWRDLSKAFKNVRQDRLKAKEEQSDDS